MYSTVLFKPRMQLILISARKWLAYQNVLLFLVYVVIGVASPQFEPQKAAPSILYSPTNVTVIIHRTPMQMQCVTDGEPFPTVTWQHRPNTDDQWHNVRRHLAGRYRYTKSGQKLEFRKLLMSDIGFYRCVARNVLGSVHSDLAFLNIQAEAEIIELSPRTNGTVANWGTELVLRCLAVGVPAPDVTWTVDGQPLYATSVSTLPTYTRADVKVNVTHTASYECTAQNDHIEGHTVVTATTDIHVKGKNTSAASLTVGMQAEVDLSQKDLIIAVAVATATIALVLVAVAAVFCCRYCYPKLIFLPANGCTKDAKNVATKSHSIVPVDFEVDVEKLPSNAIYCQTLTDPLNVKLQTLECRRNDLKYVSDIGRGAFGQIFQASGPIPSQGISATTSVAVKVLDENDPEVEQEFLRSTLILAELSGHPNVIRLLGVCLTTRPYCIIVEYANAGDLHRFLRDSAPDHFIERWRRGGNHRDSSSEVSPHLTAVQQIDICRQIAAGMEHIAHSGFIHRDLAARNCLVSIHQHRIEIKIADFGLTRRLPLGVACYEGADAEEIAVRWTALEAVVDGRFSVASDIWSFGVTVWEVFSFASRPYGDLESTADVVRQVVTGRMLDRPDGTPEAVYDLMVACWDTDPSKRPPFTDLVSSLGVIKHRLKH